MKYQELPRVQVSISEYDASRLIPVSTGKFEGRFHSWGTGLSQNSEPVTVCFVEDQEGHIHTVPPTCIRFLDSEDHKKFDAGMDATQIYLNKAFDKA